MFIGGMAMKNQKESKENIRRRKEFNKGRIFVKTTAGILALLMLTATLGTLIFALI